MHSFQGYSYPGLFFIDFHVKLLHCARVHVEGYTTHTTCNIGEVRDISTRGSARGSITPALCHTMHVSRTILKPFVGRLGIDGFACTFQDIFGLVFELIPPLFGLFHKPFFVLKLFDEFL